jgi:hypothetical protein
MVRATNQRAEKHTQRFILKGLLVWIVKHSGHRSSDCGLSPWIALSTAIYKEIAAPETQVIFIDVSTLLLSTVAVTQSIYVHMVCI